MKKLKSSTMLSINSLLIYFVKIPFFHSETIFNYKVLTLNFSNFVLHFLMQKSDWAHYAGVMPHCIHFDTFNYCWNLYFPRLSAIISRNNAVNFILALFICNKVRCYGFSNKMRRTHTQIEHDTKYLLRCAN